MPSAYFQKWYAANKDRLADKRKKTYREDSEYRARALARSAGQRAKVRGKRPPNHDVPFAICAVMLGVPTTTLREWRRKNYFPEPYHHQSKMYFSNRQVTLVRAIRNYFANAQSRPKHSDRWRLLQIIDWVKDNW